MSYTFVLRAAAVGLVCLLSAAAPEAAPVTLTYEGDLVANGGGPAQGEHKVEFALYTTSAGGAAIWNEVHPDVLVVDGHFFVDLGRQSPLDTLSGDDTLFLGVAVDDDAEAEPRMTVGGALRSQWAALAANAQDVHEADIQPRSVSLAGTPTRLENGSLRLGAEVNEVLTAASLATLTGGGNADALHTHAGQGAARRPGTFLGVTAAQFTGNMGGRFGVNAKCSAEFPNSHQCTACDVLDDELTAPLAAAAWVRPHGVCEITDRAHFRMCATIDSQEWTSDADPVPVVNGPAPNTGPSISREGVSGATSCSQSLSIACCAN